MTLSLPSLLVALLPLVAVCAAIGFWLSDRSRRAPLFIALALLVGVGVWGLWASGDWPRVGHQLLSGRPITAINEGRFALHFGVTLVGVLVLGGAISTVTRTHGRGPVRSPRGHLGNARFASWSDVRHLTEADRGFILGQWGHEKLAATLNGEKVRTSRRHDGKLLRWNGAGSLLSFAPPGGGKGTSIVIPTLLDYDGPVICNDTKGENYAIAAVSRRLMGHRVGCINPFGIHQIGAQSDAFNALDYVREGSLFASDCKRIAEAIVEKSIAPGGNTSHFEESAIAIIAGGIALLIDAHRRSIWPAAELGGQTVEIEPYPATLPGLFDFLNRGQPALDAAFAVIVEDPRMIGGRLARAAATVWMQIGADEKGSHYSTMMRFIGSFGDEAIRNVTSHSTFDLQDLRDKTAPLDIFICIPFQLIRAHKALVRVLYATAVGVIIDGDRPPRDVLLLMDEMASIGQLDAILNREGAGALTIGRSAGIRVWGVIQSLAQLEACFGREGLRLWSSTGSVVSFMNVGGFDKETAEYVSGLLGDYTIEAENETRGRSHQMSDLKSGRNKTVSANDQARRLLKVDEVASLPEDCLFAIVTGDGGAKSKRPILCRKATYYDRQEWAGRFARNPWYQGEEPLAIADYREADRVVDPLVA
jgi:type IV secretion system protein VirD4